MVDILLLVLGLIVLVLGGDVLVRGAVAIAEKLSIPPLIIGLTIVSLGTSAPELFISVQAALSGSGGLAIGNVVGSNIANVLLVLGFPALIKASLCEEDGIGRNILVMIGITLVFMGMLAKGSLGFIDGIILLALLVLFLWDQYRATKKLSPDKVHDYHEDVPPLPSNNLVSIGLLVAGAVLLPLGAWLTVTAAHNIALELGVPDEIIGLTVVAIGTSLPELAASLMAVIRGNSNVAIGNVVGSNIFNIAAIMGITTVIAPVPVGGHIISIDMWVMLAVSLLLAWLAYYKKRISRRSGVIMSLAYIIYLGAAFLK
ncbi:MAG: calcium/sodium antiporter [Rhizobiaceae bacterium]|nr:calcium/sodium antiporter [Rhizobiaceae bacterium]